MTRDRAASIVLSGAAILMPAIGLLGPLGLSPLFTISAVLLLAIQRGNLRPGFAGLEPLAALLGAVGLLGCLSTAWSVLPAHSLFEGARFLVISVGGLVLIAAARTLPEEERARVRHAVLAGLAIGLAIEAFELNFEMRLRRLLSGIDKVRSLSALDRGATVLVLVTLPALAGLRVMGHRWAMPIVAAVVFFALNRLSSLASEVAFVGAAAAFLLALWRPRLVAVALGAGFAAAVALMPVLPPTGAAIAKLSEVAPFLRTSAQHRLAIWAFTADRIAERPLLGWGMDASRELPGGKTEVRDYIALPPDLPLSGSVLPLHPHNAVLQWWVELGIPGALLGLSTYLWIVWRAVTARMPRVDIAFGLALVTAASPVLMLSFGVWQSWWQSGLWLTAALLIAVQHRAPSGAVPERR